jgi:hypothetical protein
MSSNPSDSNKIEERKKEAGHDGKHNGQGTGALRIWSGQTDVKTKNAFGLDRQTSKPRMLDSLTSTFPSPKEPQIT